MGIQDTVESRGTAKEAGLRIKRGRGKCAACPCVLPDLVLEGREAALDGLESIVHLLHQVFEFIEPLGHAGFVIFRVGISSHALVDVAIFVGCGVRVTARSLWIFQPGNLPLDHRHHFDAQIVALEQIFERGNGGGVTASAERIDGSHANGKMRLGEIRRDLSGDVFVFLFQTAKAIDGRGA